MGTFFTGGVARTRRRVGTLVRSRAAIAAAVGGLSIGGPAACYPIGRSLGWWGQQAPDASLEVRNGFDVAVNVNVVSDENVGRTFAGQVGPRGRHTFRLPGLGIGTRAQLRATPVDGRPVIHAENVKLKRKTVWQIP